MHQSIDRNILKRHFSPSLQRQLLFLEQKKQETKKLFQPFQLPKSLPKSAELYRFKVFDLRRRLRHNQTRWHSEKVAPPKSKWSRAFVLESQCSA